MRNAASGQLRDIRQQSLPLAQVGLDLHAEDLAEGFGRHPSVNLEHEDAGMMQNFEVLPPPTLKVDRDGNGVSLSWPDSEQVWRLEASPEAAGGVWVPAVGVATRASGRWTVTLAELNGRHFYRLVLE